VLLLACSSLSTHVSPSVDISASRSIANTICSGLCAKRTILSVVLVLLCCSAALLLVMKMKLTTRVKVHSPDYDHVIIPMQRVRVRQTVLGGPGDMFRLHGTLELQQSPGYKTVVTRATTHRYES
jgi:hypothetical protein